MFERFTQKAINAMMLAKEEARGLGHNFVGTEQILLGLIAEGTGVAAKSLNSMGVNLKDARIEVEKIIGRGSGIVAAEIPFTPRVNRVLDLARQAAEGFDFVDTEHILMGILLEGEGVAVRVLEHFDINPELLVESLYGGDTPEKYQNHEFSPAQKSSEFEEIEIPDFLKKDSVKDVKQSKDTNFICSFFRRLKLKFRPEEDGISKKI